MLTQQPISDDVGSHTPWKKGRLIGPKPPLKLRESWSIRIRLQMQEKTCELALFNLASDSKLCAWDLVTQRVHDVADGGKALSRAVSCSTRLVDV